MFWASLLNMILTVAWDITCIFKDTFTCTRLLGLNLKRCFLRHWLYYYWDIRMVTFKTSNVSVKNDISKDCFRYFLVLVLIHLNVKFWDMFISTMEHNMSQINKLKKHLTSQGSELLYLIYLLPLFETSYVFSKSHSNEHHPNIFKYKIQRLSPSFVFASIIYLDHITDSHQRLKLLILYYMAVSTILTSPRT